MKKLEYTIIIAFISLVVYTGVHLAIKLYKEEPKLKYINYEAKK